MCFSPATIFCYAYVYGVPDSRVWDTGTILVERKFMNVDLRRRTDQFLSGLTQLRDSL